MDSEIKLKISVLPAARLVAGSLFMVHDTAVPWDLRKCQDSSSGHLLRFCYTAIRCEYEQDTGICESWDTTHKNAMRLSNSRKGYWGVDRSHIMNAASPTQQGWKELDS